MKLLYSIALSILTMAVPLVSHADETTASLPYSQDFSTSASFDTFTVFHGGDSRDWDYSSGKARYYGNRYSTADAWMLTPRFHLEAGKTYALSFSTRISSDGSSNYKDLYVYYGTEATATGLEPNQVFKETISSKTETTKEMTISVPIDGDYYLAFRCYGNTSLNDIYVDNINFKELILAPDVVKDAKAKAADKGELKATVSWTNPDKNNDGTVLGSISRVEISNGSNAVVTVTEGLTPGGQASAVVPVETAGAHSFSIVAYTGDNGSEPVSVESDWIGPDESILSLSKVTATADPDNEKAVTLTWNTPAGSNGGWVDPLAVTYKIVRSGASTGDVTLEEAWSGEPPYRDATIPGLDSYTYKITTTYNGKTSWSATSSNAVTTGGAMALPYSQDFSATNSFNLFTVFHGADCPRDWSRSSSAANYWGSPADAWLLTPRFHLEAGKAYSLSFTARVNRASSPKNLYVYTGTEANAENLEQSQIFHEEISNTLAGAGAREMIVNVQTTGDYYIAFRCFGPSDSNDLYVDDIKFEEIEITPDVVADAKVTAADAGALSAIVSWTNPDKTNAGSTLEAVSAIEISDGTNVVATVTEGLVPGSPASVAVPVDGAGFHSFSIVALSGEKRSKAVATDKAWIGPDTPVAVTNLTVTDTPDGRVVSFDAPTASVNGGYVDFDALTYTVSRNEDVLDNHLTATTFTDSDKDLSLAKYIYSVTAAYLDNVSEPVTSAPMVLGDALKLPYQPSFDKENKEHFDLWLSTDNDGNQNTGWKYDTSKQGFQSSNKDQWAFTPPILMEQGSVELAFKASCYNGRNTEEMDVYLTQSTNPSDRPATDPAANEVSAMADAPLFKLVHSSSVEDVNWPSEEKVAVSVPQYGIYRFAFHNKTGNMYLTLHQANVTQTGTTGIENVSTGTSALIRVEGSTIVANGAVSVYNLAGECVASGEGQLSTASLLPGLYIAVDANGNSLKFQK